MITILIPPDTPQTSPRHPPDISREHQKPTDNNIRQQTLPDSLKQHLSVSGGVCDCLFMSVGPCCHLLASCVYWICLGGVWGMFGEVFWGIWVVFMKIGGAWMCLGGIWVLSPCSMEPQHYFGKTLNDTIFLHLTVLRQQNIKMSIYKVDKNDWVIWCFYFLVPVREK